MPVKLSALLTLLLLTASVGYSQSGTGQQPDSVVVIPYRVAIEMWRDLSDYDLLRVKSSLQEGQIRAYAMHSEDLKRVTELQAKRIIELKRQARQRWYYAAGGALVGIMLTR
jgi:hypothetical protein